MTFEGPQARFLHILSVVSRSGRAAAEVGRVDLDETDEDLDAISRRIAAAAHPPLSDAERHADLARAIVEAIEAVETVPGQPATREVNLADGRRVRVTRIISF